MRNFKTVGRWWADKEIEVVEIEGELYALSGWNGESYLKSWKCIGDQNMDSSDQKYEITPQYKEIAEDDYKLVGYKVQ